MIHDKELIDSLIICDLVVWNGVISEWGTIKHHYTEGDMIRIADDEEIQQYKDKKNG
jgi:hypothetical protein